MKVGEFLKRVEMGTSGASVAEGVKPRIPHGTKMRYNIEAQIQKLKNLKKKDGDSARKAEDETLVGLMRMQEKDPLGFLYSFLEIVGARGKYKDEG